VIRTVKQSSLRVMRQLGLGRLVAGSEWRRQRLLILCYHGIALADEHDWCPGLYVQASHLEQRLEVLRRLDCNVLPLGEALARLYRGELPPRAVALTFDDGYFDFKARAWPLLRRFGYPATVYVTTGRVERNLPNVNLLMSYALWKSEQQTFDGRDVPGLGQQYALGSMEERQQLVQRVVDSLLRGDSGEQRRDDVAELVTRRAGLDYAALRQSRLLTLLRPEELRELAAEGVDFQLHTHMHRTPEDPREFVRDVLVNRERLHAMTGTWPSHFCYPSGNYHQGYVAALREHGIESATTCDPGLATRAMDPLLLPRFVDTDEVSSIVFESWVTGLAARLPRRTRRGGTGLAGYHIPTGRRYSRAWTKASDRESRLA
jgi:peptidoglycan/xylan/chitin deacetylase (PgdA/CDA1 family)